MRVKALKPLYVDIKYREEGDIFELENPKDFSPRSMKKMGEKMGEKKSKKADIEDEENSPSAA